MMFKMKSKSKFSPELLNEKNLYIPFAAASKAFQKSLQFVDGKIYIHVLKRESKMAIYFKI